MANERFRKSARAALGTLTWCLALGVLVLNLVLLGQNRSLRSEMDSLRAGKISPGQQLRELSGVSLDGRLRAIPLPVSTAERLLIIGFSPDCKYCRANQGGWQTLARAIEERRDWRVIWVSRDSVPLTAEYCRVQALRDQDVLADPPETTYSQLGLRSVPRTIVVGPEGIVKRVWSGQLSSLQWREVYAYMSVPDNALPQAALRDLRIENRKVLVSQELESIGERNAFLTF